MPIWKTPRCTFDLGDRPSITWIDNSGETQFTDIKGQANTARYLAKLIENNGKITTYEELVSIHSKPSSSEYYNACNRSNALKQFNLYFLSKKAIDAFEELIEPVSGIGYRFSCDDLILVPDFSLFTMNETNYLEPESFIEPKEWIDELNRNAFRNNYRVHAITGTRGLGKTELAKYYAFKHYNLESPTDDLSFKNVLYTKYKDESSLKECIAQLDITKDTNVSTQCDNKSIDELFERKITALKLIEKPSLLIIDNYDEDNPEKGLYSYFENSTGITAYDQLLSTGCHILFTSRRNMENCDSMRQTVLDHLPMEELVQMFLELCDNTERTKVSEIENLISNHLLSNTYLVRLAAKLTHSISVEKISEAFSNGKVVTLTTPVNKNESIYDAYKILFNVSKINNDETYKKILLNLALLNYNGAEYSTFLKSDTFFLNEADSMEDITHKAEELINSNWIIRSNKSLSLHPLVKEIVAREVSDFKFDYIKQYVENINHRLRPLKYSPGWLDIVSDATMLQNLIDIKLDSFEIDDALSIATLYAQIASGYDVLLPMISETEWNQNISSKYRDFEAEFCSLISNSNTTQKAINEFFHKATDHIKTHILDEKYRIAMRIAQYGAKALVLLDRMDLTCLNNDQLYEICRNYTIIGHALNHFYGSTMILDLAREKLEKCDRFSSGNSELTKINNINKSNLAGLYMTLKRYDDSKVIHKYLVNVNLDHLKKNKDEESLFRLANNYKALGTLHYYMANEKKNFSNRATLLNESYIYHVKATGIYSVLIKRNENYNLLNHVSKIRKAGSLSLLLPYLKIQNSKLFVNNSLIEMSSAYSFLSIQRSVDFKDEINNCIRSAVRIIQVINNNEELFSDSISLFKAAINKSFKPEHITEQILLDLQNLNLID